MYCPICEVNLVRAYATAEISAQCHVLINKDETIDYAMEEVLELDFHDFICIDCGYRFKGEER